jgi:hypothetical protein
VGVASLLLLMRRQRPVAVLVTQCVVLTIPALIFGSSEMVGVILPLLIGVYSMGAFAPARPQRVVGGAAVAAALIAHELDRPRARQLATGTRSSGILDSVPVGVAAR